MREEIEKELVELQIVGRETRKSMGLGVLIVCLIIVFFYAVPYFYPQFSVLLPIGVLAFFFGGMFIIFVASPTLYKPLKEEFQAFQKIAKAIEILEKSNEPIACEEAYRSLKRANKILKGIKLDSLVWYSETNETVKGFLENLELIVLPETITSTIVTEHLEDIALAVVSANPLKIEEVNKTLESNYKKHKPQPTKIDIFSRRFRESMIGKALISLALGYGLILLVCLIYVLATEQDFMVFVREKPDIVILGGLGITGITLWKTK